MGESWEPWPRETPVLGSDRAGKAAFSQRNLCGCADSSQGWVIAVAGWDCCQLLGAAAYGRN